jgi:cholesterol oxidase
VRDRYDTVVIGSGFGGAVVACRLAAAGRSVLVLERGKRWLGQAFPRAIGQVAAEAFWDEGRSYGFLEYAAFKQVDVIVGAGVGGGSLHYFNVNVPADAHVFKDRRWPEAITLQSLDPYYEMARQMLGSAALRPPPGRSALPGRTTAFLQAAQRAGYETEQVPIAVYTGEPRVHPDTGLSQNPCNYSGNCLFGCDIGAKNSLDTNYLAVAERRHGAEIQPLHQVDSIAAATGGGYEVRYRELGSEPQGPSRQGVVVGTNVVVSAGALGSTSLLLACRDRERSLPQLGAPVGRRFSLNGEFLFAHAYNTSARVDPGLGPPITARATVRGKDSLITVEDLGFPDQLMWYLEGAMPPRLGRLRGLALLAWAYLKRTVGAGGTTSPMSLALGALVGGGRTANTIPYLGMGTDSSDGEVSLTKRGLEIAWNTHRNRALYRDMERAMKAISEAAGGRFASSFLYSWPLRKILTAHPLGGCVMGDDPATSVVNDRGEVWGHPGLFVVDGSMIPTALAVNPSLTIAALAERAASQMVNA